MARRAKRRARRQKREQERRRQKQLQERRAEEERRKRLQQQQMARRANSNPLSAGGNSLAHERELWGPVGSLLTACSGAGTSNRRLSKRRRALETKIGARMAQQEAKWDQAKRRKQ